MTLSYTPLVRCGLDVSPGGVSLYAMAPRAPANQRSADRAGVYTLCGGVSTGGITFSVPGVSGVYMS